MAAENPFLAFSERAPGKALARAIAASLRQTTTGGNAHATSSSTMINSATKP